MVMSCKKFSYIKIVVDYNFKIWDTVRVQRTGSSVGRATDF